MGTQAKKTGFFPKGCRFSIRNKREIILRNSVTLGKITIKLKIAITMFSHFEKLFLLVKHKRSISTTARSRSSRTEARRAVGRPSIDGKLFFPLSDGLASMRVLVLVDVSTRTLLINYPVCYMMNCTVFDKAQ